MNLTDRLWLWRYRRRGQRRLRAWHASPEYAKIRACKHLHREPNRRSTMLPAERCLDCGTGIVTIARQPFESETNMLQQRPRRSVPPKVTPGRPEQPPRPGGVTRT